MLGQKIVGKSLSRRIRIRITMSTFNCGKYTNPLFPKGRESSRRTHEL